jgi:hypothetical protein
MRLMESNGISTSGRGHFVECRPEKPGCANLMAPRSTGETLNMSQDVMEDLETIEGVDFHSGPWKPEAALKPEVHTRFRKMNARSVEFVAKPDKIGELRDCFRGPITEFLKRRRGFSGAVVLTSHKEPRLILVISLWRTERDATDNRWEETRVVRRMVGPLVDASSRVHTYEALLPQPSETKIQLMDMQVC